ncbi:hypothetical protein R1sor_016461 [Riccia sorocarpa]|uniref:Polyprotein n=1 Tax=Riccia sorocarpa TaxID=122646 RepID=A0ABD3HF37_9MARC
MIGDLSFSFPADDKLVGSANYLTWKWQVQTILELDDLWDLVVEPEDSSDSDSEEVLVGLAAITNFCSLKMKPNSTSADFMRKVNLAINQLCEQGEKPSKEMVIERVLNALPRRYELVIRGISTNSKLPSFEELAGLLQLEDDRERNRNQDDDLSWLIAQFKKTLVNRNSQNARNKSGGTYRPPHARSTGTSSTAPTSDSRTYQNKSSGFSQASGDNKTSEERQKRCERCGRRGHTAPKCRMDYRRIKQDDFAGVEANSATVDSGPASEQLDDDIRDFLLGKSDNKQDSSSSSVQALSLEVNAAVLDDDLPWLLDSSASRHVTGSAKAVGDLRKLDHASTVTSAGGTVHDVSGVTDVHVNLNGETQIITNVLYVPTCSATEDQLELARIWHARLGHHALDALHYMTTHQTALGLPGHLPKLIGACADCLAGKHSRDSFPEHSETRSTRILQLLHADLCGPFPVSSMGGAKYILTIVDDFSRKGWALLLHYKSDTFQCFTEFKTAIESETGVKVTGLRTHRGGEFMSTAFLDYCKRHGIKRQLTVARTPQQNGVVKRRNRILLERMRSLMIAANTPKSLWGEAVTTAIYLVNVTPTRANSGVPPYTKFFGRRPDLSHLRIFGCTAYMHVPSNERTKLDSKTRSGMVVGYDTHSKAYRVYDPEIKKVRICRDVHFDEHKMGWIPSISSLEPVPAQSSPSPSVLQFHSRDLDSTSPPGPPPSSADHHNLPDSSSPRSSPLSPTSITPESPDSLPAPVPVIIDPLLASSSDVPTVIPFSTVPAAASSTPVPVPAASPMLPSSSCPPPLVTCPSPPPSPPAVPPLRATRSGRIVRPPQRYIDYNLALTVELREPESFQQALQDPRWRRAIAAEIQSLKKKQTCDLAPLPSGARPISARWIFRIKPSTQPTVAPICKARLVARGFQQRLGIDYFDTFAPVVKFTTLRAVLSLSARAAWPLHHLDIKSAFLQGELDEAVYLCVPDGFPTPNPASLICRLNKPLYGLRQAPRQWYSKIHTFFVSQGLHRSSSDPGLYLLSEQGQSVVVLLYVDDLLITGDHKSKIQHLQRQLQHSFEISALGLWTITFALSSSNLILAFLCVNVRLF